MLRVEITGDKHPKTFTVVSDDSHGENDAFANMLKEAFTEEDALYKEWMSKDKDSDGHLRLIIPPDSGETVGELMLDYDWPGEGQKILDCIESAREEALDAMGEQE